MDKLRRMAPPGFPLREETVLFRAAFVIAFLWSLTYFFRLHSALFWIPLDKTMPTFSQLMEGRMFLFWAPVLVALGYTFAHYASYYHRSRSIYLMRRLPDRGLLLRQCVTLPLLGLLTAVLTVLILLAVYYGVYLLLTPEEYVTAGQWQMIGRAFYA